MRRVINLTTPELILSCLSYCEKFTILRKGIANTLHIARQVAYIGTRTTRIITGIITLAITVLNFPSLAQSGNKLDVVVIDAGHGGKDPGTRGSYTKEKDIALKVTLKLGEIIKENMKDVKVLYTRDKDVLLILTSARSLPTIITPMSLL